MTKQILMLAACATFIVGCSGGGGGGGNTSNSGDPAGGAGSTSSLIDQPSVPDGASASTTLTATSNGITLVGIANIQFGANDAASGPVVTVTKTKTPQSVDFFANAQLDLGIQTGTAYEAVVTVTVAPTMDTTVGLIVPDALAALRTDNNALIVYLEAPSEEEPGTYLPLESTYDEASHTVSASVPSWAFFPQEDGRFKLTLKLGLATAYPAAGAGQTGTVFSALVLTPPSGDVTQNASAFLLCPLSECVETSRVGPRVGGVSDYHYGMDLRANFVPVYAARDSIFVRYDRDLGTFIFRTPEGFYIKYTHLQILATDEYIKSMYGASVSAGDKIGASGITGTKAAHLHIELIGPVTHACITSQAGTKECKTSVFNYIDPFPAMVYKTQLFRISNSDQTSPNDDFNLELRATDRSDKRVTTEINNYLNAAGQPQTIRGTIRKVVWGSDSTALSVYPLEQTSGSNPEIGLNYLYRNIGFVHVNQEASAVVTAHWDGIGDAARYQVAHPSVVITGASCKWISEPAVCRSSEGVQYCAQNSIANVVVTGTYWDVVVIHGLTGLSWLSSNNSYGAPGTDCGLGFEGGNPIGRFVNFESGSFQTYIGCSVTGAQIAGLPQERAFTISVQQNYKTVYWNTKSGVTSIYLVSPTQMWDVGVDDRPHVFSPPPMPYSVGNFPVDCGAPP